MATTYRDASRRQADHAELKLRRVGCHSAAGASSNAFAFTDEEIEVLARLEHVRYMADRFLDGWTYGRKRDDARKKHPALVPYDELDEDTKEIDRSTVRALPESFQRVGRSIRRVTDS